MRKILNYLFLNIFVLIKGCSLSAYNYQTISKYYLTESQLEEIFLIKKQ